LEALIIKIRACKVNCQYLMDFIGYSIVKEEEMCGSLHTISLYFEYLDHTLAKEIVSRSLNSVR